jgi:TnpA family transposase
MEPTAPHGAASAAVRQSFMVEQETEHEPTEIMIDAAGYSAAVFGLLALAPVQSCLADLGDAKLRWIDPLRPRSAFAKATGRS